MTDLLLILKAGCTPRQLETATQLQTLQFFSGNPVASWMHVHRGNRFSVSFSVVLRWKVSSLRSFLSVVQLDGGSTRSKLTYRVDYRLSFQLALQLRCSCSSFLGEHCAIDCTYFVQLRWSGSVDKVEIQFPVALVYTRPNTLSLVHTSQVAWMQVAWEQKLERTWLMWTVFQARFKFTERTVSSFKWSRNQFNFLLDLNWLE
jgi:hypothetical protein